MEETKNRISIATLISLSNQIKKKIIFNVLWFNNALMTMLFWKYLYPDQRQNLSLANATKEAKIIEKLCLLKSIQSCFNWRALTILVLHGLV